MTNREVTRIWHSDGSATDIVTITRETQGWFGPTVHREVHKIHRSRKEIEAEKRAKAIAGGVFVAGGLILAGLTAIFGGKDDDK